MFVDFEDVCIVGRVVVVVARRSEDDEYSKRNFRGFGWE
jgi:hypothetical protein